ncbi:MAG TPA: 50S ribosomal protein L11 methyltransferase [Kofleriaceae bacterium]|nr:50S ribosomal protein L11 methyltransferase [Kofleriaceae bacterium]
MEEAAALIAAMVPDAASGLEVRAGEVVFWVPRERGEAATESTRQVVATLVAAGQPLDADGVTARAAVPEPEWRDAWKRYFRTVRLTRQIVVVPSWDVHDPAPDDRVVHLDPGMAFGTGAHESTRLILGMAQELADRGARPARVLDLGTGSGILALAVAALWPEASVLALDNDPLAIEAARENIAANRAEAAIRAEVAAAPPGSAGAGRFDLVMANIQADVLTGLADSLAPAVAPGGWLALSGLLAEQAAPVAEVYRAQGLELVEIRPGEGDPAWSAVLLRCSAS